MNAPYAFGRRINKKILLQETRHTNIYYYRGPTPTVGQSGFSVIELLVALTLMSLLAASLLTVILTGGAAFGDIIGDKDAQSELRVAMSYITVKLRQNNALDRISVEPSDSATNVRDVIRIAGDPAGSPGENYYIYFEEAAGGGRGRLVEKYSGTPGVDDPVNTRKIADLTDFEVSWTDESKSAIRITASYDAPPPGASGTTREVTVSLLQ